MYYNGFFLNEEPFAGALGKKNKNKRCTKMRLLIFEASRHATVVTISLLHCSCIEGKGLPHITSGCISSAQQAFFSAIPLPSVEDQKKMHDARTSSTASCRHGFDRGIESSSRQSPPSLRADCCQLCQGCSQRMAKSSQDIRIRPRHCNVQSRLLQAIRGFDVRVCSTF